MRNKTNIKRSIFSLFIQILVIQFIFFILFFSINFYIDYEGLENKSPVSYLLTIEVITLFIFLLISFFITLFIFIRWHFNTVVINDASLRYRKGLFLKKFKVDFKDIESVSLEENILGDFFESSTICIKIAPNGKNIKISNLNNAAYYASILRRYIKGIRNYLPKSKEEIYNLISRGEKRGIEFKGSLRWDIKLNKVNKEIEKTIMKVVCGFMNAEAGILLIGIGDNSEIIGLENDYKTLRKYGKDYFEIHFYHLVGQMIGKEYLHLIDVAFYSLEEREICLVQVFPSETPVYLRSDNQEIFYVRAGNTIQPLSIREAEKYIKSHWKG